jgi:hypothetical protein
VGAAPAGVLGDPGALLHGAAHLALFFLPKKLMEILTQTAINV